MRLLTAGRGTMPEGWAPREVYVIRYATRPSAVVGEHFMGHRDDGDHSMPIDYYVWLVAGEGAAVLVDAGFTPQTAQARPGRQHLGSPLEVAEALGYPVERIPSVVVTHLHYDHTGYLDQLPDATIHVQAAEMAFWTGRHVRRGLYASIATPEDVAGIVRANFAGRVDVVDGDAEIATGVTVHHVGGHTPGMQVVRVAREGRDPVVLASDASHFDANLCQDRPFSIADSTPGMYDAFDRIHALATTPDRRLGPVVTGHDPLVAERWPAAPGLDGPLAGRAWRVDPA